LSNLTLRVLTALVTLPVIFGVLFFSPVYGIRILVLIVVALGCAEIGSFALEGSRTWRRYSPAFFGPVASAGVFLFPAFPVYSIASLAALPLIVFLVHAGDERGVMTAVHSAAFTLFTSLYVGGLLAFLALTTAHSDGRWWGFMLLGTTFVSDTSAYFTGRTLGKRPLAPAISPKKTWEGAIGGVVFVMIWTAAAKALFLPSLLWSDVLLFALAASFLCQSGDLFMSMLKRRFGAKDSGSILPGHGGIMDRLDAMLFISPLVYAFSIVR